MVVYKGSEYKGYGKQNYYRDVIEVNGREVLYYKHHRYKSFDGKENEWNEEDKLEGSWDIDDENIPGRIREKL